MTRRRKTALIAVIIIGVAIPIAALRALGVFAVLASASILALHDAGQSRRDERYRIPEGAVYLVPARETRISGAEALPVSVAEDSPTGEIYFRLFQSQQSMGFFHYFAWVSGLDEGALFLRAFEYNTNRPLWISENPAGSNTTLRIGSHSEMKKYGPRLFVVHTVLRTTSFFYLARFELWHSDSLGREQMLLAKNYRITGFID